MYFQKEREKYSPDTDELRLHLYKHKSLCTVIIIFFTTYSTYTHFFVLFHYAHLYYLYYLCFLYPFCVHIQRRRAYIICIPLLDFQCPIVDHQDDIIIIYMYITIKTLTFFRLIN